MAEQRRTTTRTVGLVERLLVLRSLPALDGFSDREVELIAHHTRERFFPAGTVLLDESEPVESIFVVVEGRVELRAGGQLVAVHERGLGIGSVRALGRGQRGLRAVALADTLTLELTAHALFDILEDHFGILTRFMRRFAVDLIAELRRHRRDRWVPPSPPEDLHGFRGRRLDLVERILFIRRSRAFAESSMDAIAMMAKLLEQVEFPAGATIWREGARADGLLLVVSGTVAVRHARGAATIRYTPTGILGGVDVLAERARWGTATAETAVVGLWAEREVLVDLFEDDFELAMNFLAMMARTLVELRELQHGPRADKQR